MEAVATPVPSSTQASRHLETWELRDSWRKGGGRGGGRGGREESFDYFHPLKASLNIQSRTPFLSRYHHLLFQLSYTSFTFRREGWWWWWWWTGGKGERDEIGRERIGRSVTLQVPRPRSLSWATSIDNLLTLSLSLLPFLVGIIGIPRSGGNIALPERVLQVESSATTQATMTPEQRLL